LNSKIKILILSLTPLLWRGAGGELIAQPNLVNNYSFEDTVSCPIGLTEICKVEYWFQPAKTQFQSVCQLSSTDVYNSCSNSTPVNLNGYQMPKT
jgi:hypothetical protein